MTPAQYKHLSQDLLDLPLGHTKAIWGVVVTRWQENVWEIGTFGRDKNCHDAASAVKAIATGERRIIEGVR